MTVRTRFRRTAAAAVLTLLTGPLLAAEPAAPASPDTTREDTERDLQSAQQKLDAAVHEVERLSSQLGAHYSDRFMRGPMVPPRAMLGVQVGPSGDGKPGALVMEVSPGGPGEAAGIHKGDLITAIDGKDLTKGGDAGRELVEAMRSQEPDRKVKIKLLRDGKSAREVEVTPRAAPRVMALGRAFPMPPMPPGGMIGPEGPQGARFLHLRDRFDGPGDAGPPPPITGMELATLSEQLGAYFGAKRGVLVVRAGASDAYKLKDGDVIESIDGREPSSASHATRILRSYQRGEKLQLKVLRERKPLTLDVTLPAG